MSKDRLETKPARKPQPDRRTFVAMIGAAAAALAVRDRAPVPDLRTTPSGKPRWIGHF